MPDRRKHERDEAERLEQSQTPKAAEAARRREQTLHQWPRA